MTITLQAGHTYRTRDGSAEHTIDRITNDGDHYGPVAWAGQLAWWQNTGKGNAHNERPSDLVEEVRPTVSSPVRQRTVTEIIPGDYGIARVGDTDKADPKRPDVDFCVHTQSCTAEELRALAATATQLADALDIIAEESQS